MTRTLAAVLVTIVWLLSGAQESALPITVLPGAPRPSPASRLVQVTFRFERAVPDAFDVVRLVREGRGWRLADIARRPVAPLVRELTFNAPPGLDSLLVLRSAGQAGYLLDGPFRWPDHPATYAIAPRWRRTVRGKGSRAGASVPAWVGAAPDPRREAWPQCAWTGDGEWECIGVPLREAGVVLVPDRERVAFALATGAADADGVERVATRGAAWGRLVTVRSLAQVSDGSPPPAIARALRLDAPRQRPRSVRAKAAQHRDVQIDPLGASAFWISADRVVDDGWVEIGRSGRAPARLPLADVAGAPPDLPLLVTLDPASAIFGRVTTPGGAPVTGADITLSRFQQPGAADGREPPVRVMVGEMRTDADGQFRFDDLAVERYELLVMDAALGREDRRVDPDGLPLDIVLRGHGHVTGRILRNGAPAAGVRVAVLPHLARFAESDDASRVVGGESATTEDGGFRVAMPASGAAELRVGDTASGVRRIPVGPANAPGGTIDVGTIDLAPLPPLSLVLEASDGCDLVLSGPAGRTGMSVIRAVRTGPSMFEATLPEAGRWFVAAVCGPRERAVRPAVVDVIGGVATVRLSWP